MTKVPTFTRGEVLRAADLNSLALAAANCTAPPDNSVGKSASGGGLHTLRFRPAGFTVLLGSADDGTLTLHAGGWAENDAHQVPQGDAITAPAGELPAGAELCINTYLTPAAAHDDPPLDVWQPAEGEPAVTLHDPYLTEANETDAAIIPYPVRAVTRVLAEPTAEGQRLAAVSMFYGQPQPPVFKKGTACNNKEYKYPASAVVLPGKEWQSVRLQQAAHFYPAGSNYHANGYAWGIQAKMDCFGHVSFQGVSKARGIIRMGYN